MRTPTIVLFAALAHSFAQGAAEPGLLCSTDLAAGIAYDSPSGKWQSTKLKPSSKYLLARSERPNAKWEVRELGTKIAAAFCKEEFSDAQLLQCVGVAQEFYFNRKSLRFLHTYTAGYWNEDAIREFMPDRKSGDDTPAIEVGLCATL